MNAVFSFTWISTNLVVGPLAMEGFCRFKSVSMFLNSCVMSIMQAKKFFDKIILVTDKFGAEIFKSLELPIDVIYDDMEDHFTKKSKNFWAVSKIIAHTYQTEPYVHLDLDLYLWKPLPDLFKNRDIVYLYREVGAGDLYRKHINNYKQYGKKGVLKELDGYLQNENRDDVAFNCAIVGGNNVKFLNEYARDVLSYIEVCDTIYESHFNEGVFLEQYYLGMKTLRHKLKSASFTDIYRDKNTNDGEHLTHFIWKFKTDGASERLLNNWVYTLHNDYVLKVKKTEALVQRLLEQGKHIEF